MSRITNNQRLLSQDLPPAHKATNGLYLGTSLLNVLVSIGKTQFPQPHSPQQSSSKVVKLIIALQIQGQCRKIKSKFLTSHLIQIMPSLLFQQSYLHHLVSKNQSSLLLMGFVQKYRASFLMAFPNNNRGVFFDNASFLPSNQLQSMAQLLLVVIANIGNNRQNRQQHIGRIQPAPQACFH